MTKTTARASQIRQRLLQIPNEIAAQIEVLVRPRHLFRGYLYDSPRRCGKPSCHCADGDLHPAWVVATKIDQRQTTRSVSGPLQRRLSKLSTNYRNFRQAQKQIRQLHREAMALTIELENLLAEDVFGGRGRR
jgi:hypothetical protein